MSAVRRKSNRRRASCATSSQANKTRLSPQPQSLEAGQVLSKGASTFCNQQDNHPVYSSHGFAHYDWYLNDTIDRMIGPSMRSLMVHDKRVAPARLRWKTWCTCSVSATQTSWLTTPYQDDFPVAYRVVTMTTQHRDGCKDAIRLHTVCLFEDTNFRATRSGNGHLDVVISVTY